MLAMSARGIASCAQGALSLYPDIVRKQLDLPESHRLLFGLSFGHEDPDDKANTARVGRAPVGDAVRFHR
jgi:nitroreductase